MSTFLHLEFPDFDKKYYNYIQINSQRVEITSKAQDIKIEKKMNRERYIEIIKLFRGNECVEHKIDLNINKENNFHCFIGSKCGFTFHIFNYDKHNLMNNLVVKQDNNEYTLNKYDSNGLKYCRRFNIINCSKESIDSDNFNFPKHLSEGSYCINKFYGKISVEKLKQPKYYEINFESIPEKDFLLNLESNVNKYYDALEKDNNNNVMTFYNNLTKILYEKEKFKELSNLKNILAGRRKIILNKTEFDICFAYAFLQVLKSITIFPYTLYGIFLKILNDLKKNIPNSLDIIRIIFWYNEYYLKKQDFIDKITFLFADNEININDDKKIYELHDFKFIYPNKLKTDTPYKKCYDFLYQFIDDLNEDSFLLEILFLLDSDTASNRIYKNVRIFQLSLLSLFQIKENLKSIIPDVIIRKFHSKKYKLNGSYIHSYGVMECFEGTIYEMNENELNLNLIEKEDKECRYTIPLIMLFFYELFGHTKHRLDNISYMSPTHYYNPHDNYKLCLHCHKGESKRLLEFYISPKIDIINYLRFSLFPNTELISTKLWTANDLSELRTIVQKKIFDNKFECIKKIDDLFPNGQEDNKAEVVDDEEDYKYFSDYSEDYYDSDEDFNPYKALKMKKISCL